MRLMYIKTDTGLKVPYFETGWDPREYYRQSNTSGVTFYSNLGFSLVSYPQWLLIGCRTIMNAVAAGDNINNYFFNRPGRHHLVMKGNVNNKFYLDVAGGNMLTLPQDSTPTSNLVQYFDKSATFEYPTITYTRGRINGQSYTSGLDWWAVDFGSDSRVPYYPLRLTPIKEKVVYVETRGFISWLCPFIFTMNDGKFYMSDFYFRNTIKGLITIDFNRPNQIFTSTPTPLTVNDFETGFIKNVSDIAAPETGGGTVARYSPRAATANIGLYKLNKDQVRSMLNDLWTTSALDNFKKAFMGEGSDAILSLKWFYGLGSKVATGPGKKITLGNVVLNGTVGVPIVSNEFVEFDFGTVSVPRLNGDASDYLCGYRAYLPFVGVIDLDANDVVGAALSLKYFINLSDGSAICQLSRDSAGQNTPGLVFSSSCQWGYDIPVKVNGTLDGFAATLRAVTGGMVGAEASSYSAGTLSPNTAISGDFKAKIIIYQRKKASDSGFDDLVGTPSGKTFNISSASGFLKVFSVVNPQRLMMRRSNEIINLLKEGIYIS